MHATLEKSDYGMFESKKRATHPFWAPFTIMFDGPANEKAGDVLTLCVYDYLRNAIKAHTYSQSEQVLFP